jgi:hypothetical protein
VYEVSFAMFICEDVLEDGGGRAPGLAGPAGVEGGPAAARFILPPLLYMLQTCSTRSEPVMACDSIVTSVAVHPDPAIQVNPDPDPGF